MSSQPHPDLADLSRRLHAFMEARVIPAEDERRRHIETHERWSVPPIVETLKAEAKAAGLWNLWHPDRRCGPGLTQRDYAPLAEIMGRSLGAAEIFNCNAPDTGNMETLLRFGSEAQKKRWLEPLLEGEIRSAFCMSEPDIASSDAANIRASIVRDGDGWILNGRKWWSTGALDPRCKLLIFMGCSDPDAERHKRQSMILVPIDAPGLRIVRPLTVFGYDDAPHGHAEIVFEDVRVPADHLLLGEGRGFEIAQGRLGPGRLHHCMRLVGCSQRALEAMCARARDRFAFGRALADHGVVRRQIAHSAAEIVQCRLLVLAAAEKLDREGGKAARDLIAMAKIVVPQTAQRIIDRAMQIHGAMGVSQDGFLAEAFAYARAMRLADGPDAVHEDALARLTLKATP